MRQFILTFSLLSTTVLLATDFTVNTTGLNVNFTSIQAAHDAASDGDRIFISPGSYVEDLTLTKSIELHCQEEGQNYNVTGNLVIPTGTLNKTITIIGLRLTGAVTSAETSTSACQLNILSSKITGQLNVKRNALLVNDSLSRTTVAANVSIIGCTIFTLTPILIIEHLAPDAGECSIIGNKLRFGGSATGVIRCDAGEGHEIRNNEMVFAGGGFFSPNLIEVMGSVGTTLDTILIVNNTLDSDGGISPPIVKTSTAPTRVEARNNWKRASTGTIVSAGIESFFNVQGSDGVQIDAGDPSPLCTDLDLTRCDAGALGGSFSRENFTFTPGGSVCYMVQTPRFLTAGQTLSISAFGFDR
ncbi:MAG: hypothetical protein IT229_12355 [Flavobacteriales bacterium]|nr:hypothetical protein [Flavobacteriales bacterium]